MNGWWAASFVGLWLVVIALVVIVFALARQIGVLHMRLGPRGALELDEEGPPLGEMLPPIEANDVDGRAVDLTAPGAERFLLFVSPDCPICRDVLPAVPAVARAGVRTVVVSSGDDAPYRSAGSTVVRGERAMETLGIPGTPYAIVIDSLGIVRAKGTVNNLEQVEGLLDTARTRARDAAVWEPSSN